MLSFSQIKLDARTSPTAESLINAYSTKKSIFSRATLLNQFQYASESSGTYNFNEADDWTNATHVQAVTYGKEITSSVRNKDGQLFYYDTDNHVNATQKPDTVNKTDFSTGYLPYVYKTKVIDTALNDTYKEIDVNVKIGHLANGCGTYGHPYNINSAAQLSSLRKFLLEGNSNNLANWVVVYNEDSVFCTGSASTDKYYRANGGTSGTWTSGTYTNEIFTPDTTPTNLTDAQRIEYLRNAYYQVTRDITLSASFTGLGVSGREFKGVIVGMQQTGGGYPTITIPATTAVSNFGGLINVSYGSVVKNLNVTYEKQATVNRPAKAAGATTEYLVYFGGVIGDIEGGDNIIDNVNITYATEGLKLTGTDPHLITAGGYIGIIKAGGVVFKNMGASKLSTTVNATGDKLNITTETGTYFYTNPYVGRVLDGFAIYEQGTGTATELANTDKNYTIPTLTTTDTLSFTAISSNKSTVTIAGAQDLLMLSMISTSGAGSFNDTKYKTDAYSKGKVRNASYSRTALCCKTQL